MVNKYFYVEKFNVYDQLESTTRLFKVQAATEMLYVGTIVTYDTKKYIIRRIETGFYDFAKIGITSTEQTIINIYMEEI